MRSAFQDVVELGGLALQAEDCLIRSALRARNEHGGLATMENERYHQFIIWRAILGLWDAVLEREENTDIIVNRDGEKYYFELKNWRGKTGIPQLAAIRKDIIRLQPRQNGYMLITSVNPPDMTVDNLKFLEQKVAGLNVKDRKEYTFLTVGRNNLELEFWIAGWPVQKESPPLSIQMDQAGKVLEPL